MLNSMRGSGQSKTMWIIMGLLMFGLTFGFGLDSLRGANVTAIGTVGEEPIEVNTYARAYRAASARLSQQFGRALTPAELDQLNVQQQVLDAVAAQAALDNETANLGLSVGDNMVRDSIRNSVQFQGLNGGFDQETYRYFLENQMGMSANDFETQVRKENARVLVQNAVVGGVNSDTTMALTLLNFAQQERSFEWAALSEANLAAPVADPTQAELDAFYTVQAADYMTPLTRKVTYAWLNPADLLDQVNVDDAEIRESYDLQSDRFNRPEQRAVDRLVFPTVEEAQNARDRLDAGSATFSEIVAERGLAETDVDLGEVDRTGLSPAAADLLFSQEEPGVVGPVDSSLGPALFRINAVIQADNTPFEEVRDELRTELAGESARRLVVDLVGDLDDELAGGVRLEELNKIEGVQVGTIDYFNGVEHPLAGYNTFRTAVVALNEGDFPEILDLSDGGVFAVRLDGIEEPAQIPQDEVGDKLIADWRAVKTNEALLELAERFKPGLEQGGDLSFVGVDLTAVDGITRTSFIEALPPTAVSEVFTLELGDVTVIDAGNAAILVRLTNITDFDPDQDGNDVALDRIKEQIDAQVSLDILDYFSDALQADAGVALDQNIINQVNQQILGGGY
ncbi:SurA N-terminal domain-containing protein [Amylibacter sp. IMCC11727]|uniref:SurA N-terminal domain-containing protein n=1 Tax=Amylibacter sp. IMCC11727 TaxID=3039851 RepID=UPI00244DA7AA|nr:SurA N-terminal domain-containing protein [Amylibacter sp. IMCC11727]WGI20470.1 SurA N-terminal domain-containing protein [Amylibacter sp. IMCC11727]